MKARNYIAAGLLGLDLLGCNTKQELVFRESLTKVYQVPSTVSYKLEDLCDTGLYEKNITINVYVEPSEILWDYHKYKDEIFGYVGDFFKEQSINCKIVYSDNPFKKFSKHNEFGVEVWDVKKDMEDRYFQLVTESELVPEDNPLKFAGKGYAVTRAGIALVNGGWEEFRDQMKAGELTIGEIEKQFPEKYKGITVKEYHFKSSMAANICHELGHCMGLFHVKEFKPVLVDLKYGDVPNIMSYCNMEIKEGYSLGYSLNPLQKKLIHSFVAGNNTYRAFVDSKRDLTFYLDNIKEKNKLKYFKP